LGTQSLKVVHIVSSARATVNDVIALQLKYACARPTAPHIPLKNLTLPHFPEKPMQLIEYKGFFLALLDKDRSIPFVLGQSKRFPAELYNFPACYFFKR